MMMLDVNSAIRIPLSELQWNFVRAGGPGGQNVNKVASKAVLRWDVDASPSLPQEVKSRFRELQRRRITADGEFIISSQRHRAQDLNRQDCLEKLRTLLFQAAVAPKLRKQTKPTRAARHRRLAEKRHRARTKQTRRPPADE
jgi:ribosome-associated protein